MPTRETRLKREEIKKSGIKPPKKGGPYPFQLNEEEVYKLAKIWCTISEIASHFNVSQDVIKERYIDIVNKGKEEGKASLRRLQWTSATEGNVTMQIWLGKNLLKQSDSPIDANITPEANELFVSFMKQLNDLQSSYKMDDKSNKAAAKS